MQNVELCYCKNCEEMAPMMCKLQEWECSDLHRQVNSLLQANYSRAHDMFMWNISPEHQGNIQNGKAKSPMPIAGDLHIHTPCGHENQMMRMWDSVSKQSLLDYNFLLAVLFLTITM